MEEGGITGTSSWIPAMTSSCFSLLSPQLKMISGEERRKEEKAGEDTTMLCYMRRTKQVEKNDEDQKIEQDGVKPEDKAHKAATKIQASFRGHITRKKLKGEKKGDAPAADAEAKEKDDAPVADGVEKKEGDGPATTDAAQPPAPRLMSPARQEMHLPRRRRVRQMRSPQRKRPAQLRQKVPLKLPLITRCPPRLKMVQPRRSLNKLMYLLLSLMLLPPPLLQRMLPPRQRSLQRRLQKAAKLKEAVDEAKPKESARQDEGKEDPEADQEHA